MIQPLRSTVFFRKQELKLPYDSTTPLLGIYPKEIMIEKDTCTQRLIAAPFTIAQTWMQPRCPLTDKWI